MIELTRREAGRLRTTLRRVLGITSTRISPPIVFEDLAGECHAWSATDELAVRYRIGGPGPAVPLTVSDSVFKECGGRSADPVSLVADGDAVVLRRTDAGVRRTQRCPMPGAPESPEWSDHLSPVDQGIVPALAEASATADRDSPRYALGRVRLRGEGGQVAATDSRQLLVRDGFDVPFEGDLLVPASSGFATPALRDAESVAVGVRGDWLTVRADRWDVLLKIDRTARFPDVDGLLDSAATPTTTLTLTEADAVRLGRSLPAFPVGTRTNAPVTIDAGNTPAIRSTGEEDEPPTELVLAESQVSGPPIRLATNRRFLIRAIELGFREFAFSSADSPVICSDDERRYLWATLEPSAVTRPSPDVVRVPSDAVSRPAPSVRTTLPMPKPQLAATPTDNALTDDAPDVLERAEALREVLKGALADVRGLITALKADRKQNRLVQSTLRSLRQLDERGA